MASLSSTDYRPRDAEHSVLYRVIEEHLDTFLDAAAHHADGRASTANGHAGMVSTTGARGA